MLSLCCSSRMKRKTCKNSECENKLFPPSIVASDWSIIAVQSRIALLVAFRRRQWRRLPRRRRHCHLSLLFFVIIIIKLCIHILEIFGCVLQNTFEDRKKNANETVRHVLVLHKTCARTHTHSLTRERKNTRTHAFTLASAHNKSDKGKAYIPTRHTHETTFILNIRGSHRYQLRLRRQKHRRKNIMKEKKNLRKEFR